ncbi:FRG domain-containing protein [Janthinobacterium rivuli]|uniref:FRG domain-containing protein n=1 Tax=Janthinobacterium rivuli TaxID=2751478 RepID=A0ABY8I8K0_9BURK|nr:FRG domain-containing protein [Janthinobacterium rivuli]WFR81256.1 FRG domain-containing protein [Janthinobacterium rivuli]
MDDIKLIKVTSLGEYVTEVSKLNAAEEDSAWFRGHSSATHLLVPSVLRDIVPYMNQYFEKLRGTEYLMASGYSLTGINPERMLADFKRKALPFLDYAPKNDFEWLFLMQHHGVPTRLLDWTTNALVALYFAVTSVPSLKAPDLEDLPKETGSLNELDENSVAVIAMNPNKVNQTIHGDEIDEVVDVASDFDYWRPYSAPMSLRPTDYDTNFPICISAPQISPRIRAQSGLFTIHGRDVRGLDHFTVIRPLLTKILIPYEHARVIRKELRQFGITESFIYPSLESVSRDVLADEILRHSWDEKRYHRELDSEESIKAASKTVVKRKVRKAAKK